MRKINQNSLVSECVAPHLHTHIWHCGVVLGCSNLIKMCLSKEFKGMHSRMVDEGNYFHMHCSQTLQESSRTEERPDICCHTP